MKYVVLEQKQKSNQARLSYEIHDVSKSLGTTRYIST
uniref:Uncharacterized protein n=1 Tax=Anguilla anguilla TaxID=7936 RepID=A0A0E9TJL4_ANGAN